jgi:hypothetical protein
MDERKKGFFHDESGWSMGRLISFVCVLSGAGMAVAIIVINRPAFISLALGFVAAGVGGKMGEKIGSIFNRGKGTQSN